MQTQMPSSAGAFSPRLLGNEKRMRSEIVKMKMFSRAQTKITDGRRRRIGNYRSPRRSGRGVRISWFQGMRRGLRMKRGMSWRRKQRMDTKRMENRQHTMHSIMPQNDSD